MIEYVLILTLVGNTSQTGQSIEHVPGFVSEAECMRAANLWVKQVHQVAANRIPRALCVARNSHQTTERHREVRND